MVDWDRVEELRSKGWDWDRIAADPKVGFHPDASVKEAGRALRGLYHRQQLRQGRRKEVPVAAAPTKEEREKEERRWTLARFGYLLVPIFAVWFLFAYFIPSPVGLVLPAIPYLALGLVVAAFLLFFGLFRSNQPRWSKVYRTTLVTGVVVGLVLSGMIALGGVLFGCPLLPSGGSSEPDGWTHISSSPWQDSGRPVFYFYGASWCPYCSASSWAVWKALTQFGSVAGNATGYSSPTDQAGPSTPEMVLAGISLSSSTIAWQVSEDTSGVEGNFPSTSNCIQGAYWGAYGGGSIPFYVINGQYYHAGSSLILPSTLSSYAAGNNGGATAVQQSVFSESGTPWTAVQAQAWWVMAYLTKCTGQSVNSLANEYGWSAATKGAVGTDLAEIT